MAIHRRLLSAVLIATLSLGLAGCGETKIQTDNLRITMALRTALSAKETTWLEACRTQVEEKRQADAMTQDEYERFQRIFAQAEQGEWEAAERDVVRWQKGQ